MKCKHCYAENNQIKASQHNDTYLVNYKTSFETIIADYNVNRITYLGDTYMPKQVEMSNGAKFDLTTLLYAYLNINTVSYNNESTVVGITIIYQKV